MAELSANHNGSIEDAFEKTKVSSNAEKAIGKVDYHFLKKQKTLSSGIHFLWLRT